MDIEQQLKAAAALGDRIAKSEGLHNEIRKLGLDMDIAASDLLVRFRVAALTNSPNLPHWLRAGNAAAQQGERTSMSRDIAAQIEGCNVEPR